MPKRNIISGVTPVLNTFFGASLDPTNKDFIIVGVPFDNTSSFRSGAKQGPAAIRSASQHIESFCLLEEVNIDAAKLPLADIGDIMVASASVTNMLQSMESVMSAISQLNQTCILFGGEHTLTLGAIRALPRDIILVQFDAHMDLRDQFKGNHFSHACVMRRVVESLGSDHLIQVGIRAVSKEEYEYAKTEDITYFTVQDVNQMGAQTIADRINNTIPPGPPLYLSIDMDVLDPAYAPAVGNPEAGGLTSYQLLTILRNLAKRAIVFDVTEVTPQYDQGITATCAALLTKTFICVNAQKSQ